MSSITYNLLLNPSIGRVNFFLLIQRQDSHQGNISQWVGRKYPFGVRSAFIISTIDFLSLEYVGVFSHFSAISG